MASAALEVRSRRLLMVQVEDSETREGWEVTGCSL